MKFLDMGRFLSIHFSAKFILTLFPELLILPNHRSVKKSIVNRNFCINDYLSLKFTKLILRWKEWRDKVATELRQSVSVFLVSFE
jgi:hypothetical protein